MSNPVRIVVGEGESAEIVVGENGSAEVEVPGYGIIAGRDGPTGPAGGDGESAYQIAVDNGFTGTEEEWLASLVGPPGPQGEPGADGTVSFDELTPEQRESLRGEKGEDGETGPTGPAGQDGVSPTVAFTAITGGNRMTVTDKDHPSGQTINIMDGSKGNTGATGPAGPGLPTGGAIGQIPVKKSATNYDTEWQYPQYSRPNLFDNWYFVGGGSQLGDGVFPINQKGNAITTGYNIYPIDRWKMTGYASTQCELLATGLKLTNTSSSGAAGLRQYLPSIIPAGTKLTISVLGVGGETFTNLAVRFFDSDNNYDSLTTSQMVRDGELVYGSIELTRDCASCQLRIFPAVTDFTFKAVKLEVGDYQTLAHNEGTEANPNWVLNALPNWFEELRKCQRYLQWIPSPYSGNFAPVGSGIGWGTTAARIALPLPVPMVGTPTVTVQNSNVRIYFADGSDPITPTTITAQMSSYNNANMRSILCLICAIEGGINRAQVVLAISGTGNPGGILLSCEE